MAVTGEKSSLKSISIYRFCRDMYCCCKTAALNFLSVVICISLIVVPEVFALKIDLSQLSVLVLVETAGQ